MPSENFLRAKLRPLLLGLGLGLSLSCGPAKVIAATRIPEGFGVSAHAIDQTDINRIADAGFRIVRLTMNWDQIETAPGTYDWSKYQQLAAAMQQRGLRPLFILAYGNPLYSPKVSVTHNGASETRTAAPATPDSLQAYVRWAAQAAIVFAPYHPIWEIWNEPESDRFWPPHSDVAQYSAAVSSACQAIRSVDPNAEVIGPGAAKPPTADDKDPPFLHAFLRSSAASCLDGVSVHPYLFRSNLPFTPTLWSRLREMVGEANAQGAQGQGLAVMNSETGLSIWHGVTPDQQAAYIVKMYLLNTASGVPLDIWYDWKDDGNNPNENEDNFGLIRSDGSPKLSLSRFQTMTHLLWGYRYVCNLNASGRGVTALAFTDDRSPGHVIVSVWSEIGALAGQWQLPPAANGATAFDPDGNATGLPPGGSVSVGQAPSFIALQADASAVCN